MQEVNTYHLLASFDTTTIDVLDLIDPTADRMALYVARERPLKSCQVSSGHTTPQHACLVNNSMPTPLPKNSNICKGQKASSALCYPNGLHMSVILAEPSVLW
jgi:hypothetical protein